MVHFFHTYLAECPPVLMHVDEWPLLFGIFHGCIDCNTTYPTLMEVSCSRSRFRPGWLTPYYFIMVEGGKLEIHLWVN